MNALWKEMSVGAVLRLEYGKPLDDVDRKRDGRYPVYGANGEKDRSDRFYFDKPSIIVGRKGSAGEVNLTETKFWPLDVTYFVTFDDRQHDLRFLFYLLTTLDLPSRARGVKPGINRNEIYSQVARIPPFPEQKRIVGILDKGFKGIVSVSANAQKNIHNAQAVLQSHFESVFHKGESGWVKRTLGDICEVKDGTHESPKYVPEGIPFVTQKNIRDDGLSIENTRFITDIDHAKFYKRSNVAFGDILISMIGANRGMACLVDDRCMFSIKNVGLIKKNDAVDLRFLLYFLKTSGAAQYVKSASKGGAQDFIGLTELRRWPVHLPALERQSALVAELDALACETRRLQSIYQRKAAAIHELKKSLLHQAFAGEI